MEKKFEDKQKTRTLLDKLEPSNTIQMFYPDNLALDFTYPDVVRITILKHEGLSLGELGALVKENTKNALSQLTEELENGGGARDADGNDSPQLKQLQSQTAAAEKTLKKLGELGGGLVFSAEKTRAKVQLNRKRANKKEIMSIYLPMPENVTYSETADWQTAELGSLVAAATGQSESSGLSELGVGQIGTLLGGGAGALVSKVLGGGLLGGAVLGTLSGASGIQAGFETSLRITSNPFKEQSFKGVPFRPFEFSWTFSARNSNEVEKLKDIINRIRQYSKPDYDNEESKILFNYPHQYEIQFLTKSTDGSTLKKNEYLPKLKTCICKSINTNFATAGWSSFEDGAPTSITLQLGFEEIDIVTSTDVEDGF
jgi:hypothetical protein